MPTLYLIRHGIAAERGTYANDGDRPLTKGGIQKTQRIAQRLVDLKVTFDLILSSPLTRAQQTAEILKATDLSQTMRIAEELAPEGSLGQWLDWFQQWQTTGGKNLALVGHEPDLGHWAETLIWGQVGDRLVVKKAGIIGIELPGGINPIGKGELFWLTPPRFLL